MCTSSITSALTFPRSASFSFSIVYPAIRHHCSVLTCTRCMAPAIELRLGIVLNEGPSDIARIPRRFKLSACCTRMYSKRLTTMTVITTLALFKIEYPFRSRPTVRSDFSFLTHVSWSSFNEWYSINFAAGKYNAFLIELLFLRQRLRHVHAQFEYIKSLLQYTLYCMYVVCKTYNIRTVLKLV